MSGGRQPLDTLAGDGITPILLVVSSHTNDREDLSSFLSTDYELVAVTDMTRLREMLEMHTPFIDAIFFDMDKTTPDVIRHLAPSPSLNPDEEETLPPLIAFASPGTGNEEKAFAAGADDFVTKPFSPDVVRRRLENASARSQLQHLRKTWKLAKHIREVEHQASFDDLTNLYNRTKLEAGITRFFEGDVSHGALFLILDIDDFKMVNDELGHIKGDKALQHVADILRDNFTEQDIIARIGGDEFVVFSPTPYSDEALDEMLDNLCHHLNFKVGDMNLSCSIGVCMAPNNGQNYQTLYNNADIALLVAKRYGKNQYQIYDEGIEIPSHVLFRNMDWLLDESTDGVLVCDAQDYSVLYINAVACRLANKNRRDCIGRPCYEVMWNERQPCGHCVSLDRMSHDFCEHEITTNTHGEHHFLIKGKLVDWGGTLARIQYAQDNTERVSALRKLTALSNDRKRILDLLPGGMFRYHAEGDGVFDFISENLLDMLGYTRAEFTRKFNNRFSDMIWHEDRARALAEIDKQIACSDTDQCDYRIEKKDGTLCWVHDIGHLIEDEDGEKWFYVTIVDITELKNTQDRLARSEKTLKDALSALRERTNS